MLKITEKFERVINVALLVMLAIVVLLATIDLGWIILKDILTPPVLLLDVEELLELFGAFLLVMIGLELLDTVKIYLTKKNNPCRSCSAGGDHRHCPQGCDPGAENNGTTDTDRHRHDYLCANGWLLVRQAGRTKSKPT